MTSRPCYMSGTRIRSARGDLSIEQIMAGDDVVVRRDGQDTLEPVKWVGTSAVDLSKMPRVEDAAPIRIRQNAIAEQQPARDLFVSPEHSMLIDGLCVPAKLLVNGASIVREATHPPFSYYHLELEQHGILLAENALSESYLDTGNRSLFDNGGDVRQLHPAFVLNSESARWTTDAAAPLATDDDVTRIWRTLAARSEEIGYPITTPDTVEDSGIHARIDGRIVQPLSTDGSAVSFIVPAGSRSVTLVSRFCIPAERMIAEQRDTRRLGVRVEAIVIRSDKTETVLPPDHPSLTVGWNGAEHGDGKIWRWTQGDAVIPWTQSSTGAVLTVHCTYADAYPVGSDDLRLVA
jgi:hypothetical protein